MDNTVADKLIYISNDDKIAPSVNKVLVEMYIVLYSQANCFVCINEISSSVLCQNSLYLQYGLFLPQKLHSINLSLTNSNGNTHLMKCIYIKFPNDYFFPTMQTEFY